MNERVSLLIDFVEGFPLVSYDEAGTRYKITLERGWVQLTFLPGAADLCLSSECLREMAEVADLIKETFETTKAKGAG